MQKKFTSRLLLVLFLLTAISGIILHVSIDNFREIHIWAWVHSISALAFSTTAIIHAKQHSSWYKALRKRVNKSEVKVRRIAVLSTDALYLFLLVSGLILIPIPLGKTTVMGTIHFIIGLAAILFGVGHILKRTKQLR